MPPLLYILGTTSLYLLYGPKRLRDFFLEKTPLRLPGIESIFVCSPARILVTIPASPSPFIGVAEQRNCVLLGYYCNLLPMLGDNASVSSKMGQIGCSETSVVNYHYSLRNNVEERSSLLLRGGSRKSPQMKLEQLCQRCVFLCYINFQLLLRTGFCLTK